MPSLIAKSPLAGQAPVSHGGVTLSEEPPGRISSVTAFRGQEKALAKALKAAGLAMPAPNACGTSGDRVIVWTGRDQAFLLGDLPEGLPAAVTDQSDGWARLRLEGPGAADVLARLVPVDLRGMKPGQALRAPLNHMQAVLFCTEAGRIDLLVFRSMARTAWDEIAEAMQAVAARAARPG